MRSIKNIYLRISITDRCNMRCFYCFPQNYRKLPRKELLSFEEILYLLKIFKSLGLKKLRITGGEPLVRNGFTAFLQKLSALKIDEVCISTNGSFLSQCAIALKEAGVRRVNVSLDSLKTEKFSLITGRNLLNNVIKGIEDALACGLEVKINTVAMRGINDDEVLDLVEFAKDRGITVRFIEFMPFPHTQHNFSRFFIPYRELLNKIESRYTVEYAGLNGVAREFRIKELETTVGFITPVSKPFCNGCNRLRMTADGKLKVCLHKSFEFDLKKLVRSKGSSDEIASVIQKALRIKTKIEKPSWEAQRNMVEIGG